MLDSTIKEKIEDYMLLCCDVLNIEMPRLSFDASKEPGCGYDEKQNTVFVTYDSNVEDVERVIFNAVYDLRLKWLHDGLLQAYPNFHPAIVLTDTILRATADDTNAFAIAFMDSFFSPEWDSMGIRSLLLDDPHINDRYSALYEKLQNMLARGIFRKNYIWRGVRT